MASTSIHQPVMAGKGIPIFGGHNFAHWKLKVEWFLSGVHQDMLKVLHEGPIIPTTPIAAVREGDVIVVPARVEEKARHQWTDEDKIKYNLDAKAKSIIGNAVTEEIFSKIAGCKTAKEIWDTLLVSYEGVQVVKSQKRKSLIRKYENFFAGPKESLSEIHTRFQILLNDLSGVDVIKSDAEVVQKFLDILPDSFSEVITSLIVSEKIDDYDLSGLFGLLMNFEESKERRKLDTKRIAKDPDAALVVTSKKNKEIYSRANYYLENDGSDSEDESDDEEKSIKAEIAFLAERLEKKKFGGVKKKSTFDPKKATCYRCSKVGHIAADCKVQTEETKKIDQVADRAKKYRQKYLNLKKGGNKTQSKKTESKALYVEDWLDEELSSDDEEVEDKCLMAVVENEKTESQFEADLKEAERLSYTSDWNKASAYKVQNFKSYSDNEKNKMFGYLLIDLETSLQEKNDLKTKISQLEEEVKQKVDFINQNVEHESALDAQVKAYQKLAIENKRLIERADYFEKICKSWCISSLKNADCCSKQIPKQVQAVLGEEFDIKEHLKREFNPDILPNTFGYLIGDKTVLTNAFVRAEKQKEVELVFETESDSSDSESSDFNTSNSYENKCLMVDHADEPKKVTQIKNIIKEKVQASTYKNSSKDSTFHEYRKSELNNKPFKKKNVKSDVAYKKQPVKKNNNAQKKVFDKPDSNSLLINKLSNQLINLTSEFRNFVQNSQNQKSFHKHSSDYSPRYKSKNVKFCGNCKIKGHEKDECYWNESYNEHRFFKKSNRMTNYHPKGPTQQWVPKRN